MSNSRGFIGAGSLRDRVSIQIKNSTRNSVGEEVINFTTCASNVPANVRPLSMRERFNADQIQSDIQKIMVIRYTSNVEPTGQIVWKDKTFNIESIIDHNERQHRITLGVSRVNT